MASLLLEKTEDCCGCTACYASCPTGVIRMTSDREGFAYPQIDETKCVQCGLCQKVCCLHGMSRETHYANQIEIVAAKHTSNDVRMSSSSGGAFTAISDVVLQRSGIVYGAIYDNEIRVIHSRAMTQSQRDAMKVSKYVQSDLGNTFQCVRNDLVAGKEVLFSGTPCQVEGLKHYLGGEYPNLLTVDIICYGVPSPKMFAEHIKQIQQKRHNRVAQYSCRAKCLGWHKHIEQAVFSNGRVEYGTPLLQQHKCLFHSGMILRPSCYQCQFSNLYRPADLTLGDFWGIETCMPDYDDNIGVSLILANSDRGKEMLSEIQQKMNWRASDTTGRQPHLQHPAKKPEGRERFWQEYEQRGYRYVARKYGENNLKRYIKYAAKKWLKRTNGKPEKPG